MSVKKEKTLLGILLVPILIMVLVLGTIPYLFLVFGNFRGNIEQKTIQTDQHIIENRRVVLENDMIEHWGNVYKEGEGLNESLGKVLKEHGASVTDFIQDKEMKQEYLANIFPTMIDSLQYNTASGLFMILTDGESLEKENYYQGFFLRDSDPQTRVSTNADLLLERGSKRLSQSLGISLDSAWYTEFHFMGKGVKDCDSFFYLPYETALNHPDVDPENLGYWSTPFVLEDHVMDSHHMITYSVPLKYENTIYAILGVEVSLDYLTNFFPVKNLDNDLNAGFVLAKNLGQNRFQGIAGKGTLYNAIKGNHSMFRLESTDSGDLYQVQNADVGGKLIYCIYSPMNLYYSNVPYSDTEWVLMGLVTEDSIFGFGRDLFLKMTIMMAACMVVIILLVTLLIRHITKPVYRLMESIRQGVDGIKKFKTSHIIEIDELHDVVKKLTEAQKENEDLLLEEKERYRIAVENSEDTFFICRLEEQIIEIVNGIKQNGILNIKDHPELIYRNVLSEDRKMLIGCLNGNQTKLNLEFRLRTGESQEYEWMHLSGSILRNPQGNATRVVGCIRNINRRKLLEQEQQMRQFHDSLTSFYPMKYGIKAIRNSGMECAKNALLLFDIRHFSQIQEQYGLVLGDVLLEQLAKIIAGKRKEMGLSEAVEIRAGADQFLVWCPGFSRDYAVELAKRISDSFDMLVKEANDSFHLYCGIALTSRTFLEEKDLIQVKQALQIAKQRQKDVVVWREMSAEDKVSELKYDFNPINPVNHIKELSMSPLAMNLFDRGSNLGMILDILVCKMQEQYSFTDFIVSSFVREELVGSYLYRYSYSMAQRNGIVAHCTEKEYQNFLQRATMQEMCPLGSDPSFYKIFGIDRSTPGIVYHMMDNMQYSGSMVFVGLDSKSLTEEKRKQLQEITVIIQNKINLQRHDSSAKAKADFLARMSHEIRTPMNGIIGMTEIALMNGQSEERRMDCLKKIQGTSNYLLGLLNDILDMSKIESGKMKLVLEKCNLRELMDGLEPLMEAKISQKHLHYSCDILLHHDSFLCDGLRVDQVLLNFLSNAVKYCNENGNIKLTVKEKMVDVHTSEVTFGVQDDGVGIEKSKQQSIFQRFEQADDSEIARRQGTGLGLAISSRLVHMMDSEIRLISEPGKGSTFSFTLILKPVMQEKCERISKQEEVSLQGKRVLAVEDNPLNMEIVCAFLEEFGMQVERAENGLEALRMIERSEIGYYDLVLMDIMMPVMNGLEATTKIRKLAREDCRRIPIVAMSANAFDDDIKHSLESGMNRHMSKPINVGILEKTLKEVLQQQNE